MKNMYAGKVQIMFSISYQMLAILRHSYGQNPNVYARTQDTRTC